MYLCIISVTVTNQNTNQQEIFNTTSTSLIISNRQEGIQYSYTVAVVDGELTGMDLRVIVVVLIRTCKLHVVTFAVTILIPPEHVPGGLTAVVTGFPDSKRTSPTS